MPVRTDSRFAGLPIRRAVAPDGSERDTIALRLRRDPTQADAPRHRLREGEEIDVVALRALGAEALWWRVLDANPRLHPFDLEPGDELVLPSPAPSGRVTRARSF